MSTKTLFVYQGADFSSDMQLLNDNGTAINVANYAFTGVVRQNPYSNFPAANLKIVAFDAANGNTMITLDAANTANIAYGSYLYTIIANTGNGIVQLLSGDFIVLPSAVVTQPLTPNVVNQVLDDEFIALQGQNSFYLSYAPANTSNVVIFYNRVQQPNSNAIYTLTGQVLVFVNSANTGDLIQAKENVSVTIL
jgi:hypothetical protein